MPLDSLLATLYARRRFGIRPGVERVCALLHRLGNPEKSFRTIHVVGTNGKGSTTAFLSSILSAAGHRTGRFTSPHLINFSERFWISGKEPGADRLAELLGRVLSLASEETTFFEIVTALAATLFAEEGVEVAVMEAGMGGCSDATAALPGFLTLITPISLDHCDYLGTTLEQIATEKAAITEPGTPVICARQARSVREIILGFCRCGDSRLLQSGQDFSASWSGPGRLEYHGFGGTCLQLKPGLPGRYQAENASLALAAAETADGLGIQVPQDALVAGISTARWPGRMELIPGHPRLLLDGAHNQSGSEALAEALGDYHYERLLLVVGVMEDKDAAALLMPLASRAAHCFCVTPAIERGMDDALLAGILTGMGFEARACGRVGQGIETARYETLPGDLILVTGSLFTVGEAKAWLTGKEFQGIRG
ncbi:MAG: bifunctional folylpolyglutamate synthase/dihydrofolate synthase [Desulfuromonadales bacterium]|nr:bifunctional folylpolyglutamate synthase/dihydrofolate synthase [Desulfuromonadales bacterium]